MGCGPFFNKDKTLNRKLVVVGDGACGKTSLLNVFTRGRFPQNYEPTVFENYVHDIWIENKHIEISLWDTAEFDRLRSLSYADTHVIMLCFAVDNRDSLENVESKWMEEIREHCAGVKLVLVALKCDLREDVQVKKNMKRYGEMPVSYEENVQQNTIEVSVREAFEQSALVSLRAKRKGLSSNSSGKCILL
ncbi:4908_t:CDS:2 [Diversispora eburnea]|uniref:4908_t:CDS:1 n=1 Tax=Diversispora eburnea TaxID=1213867 RepID=A0A9N8WID9_9GLOM|nr:4908_t:CDS:2 [Diversispora eburnea]